MNFKIALLNSSLPNTYAVSKKIRKRNEDEESF